VISTHGVVVEKTESQTDVRFRVDVWCENEDQEKKTVGWVEVSVAR